MLAKMGRELNTFEQLQGPHYQRRIRCLSGVWSGTTLRRASVQLSKPSDATYSARSVGQPGCGRRLHQPGQLTIGEELLGYHNNNNILKLCHHTRDLTSSIDAYFVEEQFCLILPRSHLKRQSLRLF